eukprot:3148804-Pleurochrysis_carterae.AAC.1
MGLERVAVKSARGGRPLGKERAAGRRGAREGMQLGVLLDGPHLRARGSRELKLWRTRDDVWIWGNARRQVRMATKADEDSARALTKNLTTRMQLNEVFS